MCRNIRTSAPVHGRCNFAGTFVRREASRNIRSLKKSGYGELRSGAGKIFRTLSVWFALLLPICGSGRDARPSSLCAAGRSCALRLKAPFVQAQKSPDSFEIAEARWWLLLRSALCAMPNYWPAPPIAPMQTEHKIIPSVSIGFSESGRETGRRRWGLCAAGNELGGVPPAAKGTSPSGLPSRSRGVMLAVIVFFCVCPGGIFHRWRRGARP